MALRFLRFAARFNAAGLAGMVFLPLMMTVLPGCLPPSTAACSAGCVIINEDAQRQSVVGFSCHTRVLALP